jgi:hypothetical protein
MFEQTLRFPCASCKEIITDRAQECPYCGAPIDRGIATAAAEVQDKVNQAYSDASYMKTAAFAMWGFLGISLIPIVPLVYYGFLFTFFALIVLIVRWQLKFSNVNTSDPDYTKARRWKNLSLILWVVALPVGFIVRPLLSVIIAGLLD